jgi:hypothetical protein
VAIAEGRQLALQGATAGITAGVVVAEHAGQRQLQPRQPGRNLLLAVAEIAHHQERIGSNQLKQAFIGGIPLAVEISGDGNAEI